MPRLIRPLLALLAAATSLEVAYAAVPLLRPLLDTPTMNDLAISPNGKKIAFALHAQDKNFLALIDLTQPNQRAQPIGHIADSGIKAIWWKSDDLILAQLGTLYADDFQTFDLKAGKVNKLESLNRRYYVSLLHLLPDDPAHVLINTGDLRKLNIHTGKMTVVEKRPDGVDQWIVDGTGRAIAATGSTYEKSFLLWRPTPAAKWERRELGSEEKPDLLIVRAHPDGRRLLAWDRTAPGAARVVALDPSGMTKEAMLPSSEVEIDYAISWGVEGSPVKALQYETDTVQRFFFNQKAETLQAGIDALLRDTQNWITSTSQNEDIVVVTATSDRDPGSYHLLDRTQGKIRFLGPKFPSVDPKLCRPSRSFTFQNREGRTLHGRIILPAGTTPLPAAFVLTGPYLVGPRARNEYDAWGQVLAARGYATVRIDVRGTSGYGREFEEAGAFGLDRSLPEDLEDGVSHLIKEGLVDGNRVGLFSLSWGGVIGLQAVAGSPVIKFWANWSGPLDLRNLRYEALSLGTRDEKATITEMGGKRAADRYVKGLDPLKAAETLSIPTFHFYQHDSSVPYSDYVKLEAIVKKSGAPARFVRGAESDKPGDSTEEYYKAAADLMVFLAEHFPARLK